MLFLFHLTREKVVVSLVRDGRHGVMPLGAEAADAGPLGQVRSAITS